MQTNHSNDPFESLLSSGFTEKNSKSSALWRDACILMDDSIGAIKANWKSYFFFNLAFYAIATIAWTVAVVVLGIFFVIVLTGFSPSALMPSMYFVFGLIGILFHGFYECVRFGVGYIAKRLQEDLPAKAADAVGSTFKNLLKIIAVTFVSDLPLLVIAWTLGLFAMSSGGIDFLSSIGNYIDTVSDTAVNLAYLLLGFAAVGFILLLGHEVYRVYWSYSLYFYTFQGEGLVSAIGKGFRMVHSNFKRLFIARLAISLTMWLLGFALTWVVSGVVILLSFASMGLLGEWLVFIQQPLSLVNLSLSLVAFLFTTGLAFHAQMILFQRYGAVPAPEVNHAE